MSNNLALLLDAALDDQGIAVLPEDFTAGSVTAGRLETVLPDVIGNPVNATGRLPGAGIHAAAGAGVHRSAGGVVRDPRAAADGAAGMRPVHVFEWLSVLSILGIVGGIGLGVYSSQRKAWLARNAVWNTRMPAPTSSAGSPTPA